MSTPRPAAATGAAPLDELARSLRALVDRDEIIRLVFRLGYALDAGDAEQLRDLFVEDATARTPGGTAEGVEAVVRQAARNHRPEDGIQHHVSNVLVDLDGDQATVRSNLLVTFARREPVADKPVTLGEVYSFEVRRTVDGWRLASVVVEPVWASRSPVTLLRAG
ncbi:nuclear transport factor 2 family protein [Oerskovia sp. Root22]|uniref:nuclear transport factor 2 family protein n=1 Tax=Oerskovia sp. Root22 TaxID=1736494 RepID=UPI0006FF2A67|nr:nuclear transport factor 2 family protein [Oerskovia sp. Root22]KRC37006.1 hypothetical protein ASE15_08290 [Oerskovia sp. Root22]